MVVTECIRVIRSGIKDEQATYGSWIRLKKARAQAVVGLRN
jgi:hypothetical protein